MPRGQIIARNSDTWLVRLYQGRDPATGKRRYLNQTIRGERSSAEAELARLLSQIPPRPEPNAILDEYLDWWLHAAVEGRLRAKTARDYRTLLSLYVRPATGRSPARPAPAARSAIARARPHRAAGFRRAPFAIPTPFSAAPWARPGAGSCWPGIQPTRCRCPAPTNANSRSLRRRKRGVLPPSAARIRRDSFFLWH